MTTKKAPKVKKQAAVKNNKKTAGFKKGKSGNPKGRPKGTKNRVSMEFKEAVNKLLQDSSPKIEHWLKRVARKEPGKALDHLSRLAEYIYPKLQRTEHSGFEGKPFEIETTYRTREEKRAAFDIEIKKI